MKILILHRNPDKALTGGDINSARAFARALRAQGADVECDYTPARANLFDFVYLCSVNSRRWSLPTIRKAKKKNRRVIIMPIWCDHEPEIKHLGNNLPKGYFERVGKTLGEAWAWHLRHQAELLECRKLSYCDRVAVIGKGCDKPAGALRPREDYVLQIARVLPLKNQLGLARACKQLGVACHMIGPIVDKGYAERVKRDGGDFVTLHGKLSHGDTMRWLAAARVHANPSYVDMVATATYEAAWFGVPAVVSTAGIDPYFFTGATLCRPHDHGDIARAVGLAWDQPRGAWFDGLEPWADSARRALEWLKNV